MSKSQEAQAFTFHHTDALEYTTAFQSGVSDGAGLPGRIRELKARIQLIKANGQSVPSYLYAALRGYESALIFKQDPERFMRPVVITVEV